jgi:hypothetical protein
MAISDLILKARVNLALARDPRVGVLDIGVTAEEGIVTLTGDVDGDPECDAAVEIARSVAGVSRVVNKMTCGVGAREDSFEMLRQKFLQRLEEAWDALPDENALTQADYVRWSLWMIFKFRIPESIREHESITNEQEVVEEALGLVAGLIGAPKALLALEMLRQAESVAESEFRDAPLVENPSLTATPMVDGDKAAA